MNGLGRGREGVGLRCYKIYFLDWGVWDFSLLKPWFYVLGFWYFMDPWRLLNHQF